MSLSPINNYASYAASTPPPAPTASTAAPVPTVPVRTPAPVAPPTQATAAAKDATPVTTSAQTADDHAKLDQAIDSINRFLKPVNSNIEFSIDKDSGRTIVQVIDTDTKDVLRQFPSKEALAMSHELDKFQGLLVRDKA